MKLPPPPSVYDLGAYGLGLWCLGHYAGLI